MNKKALLLSLTFILCACGGGNRNKANAGDDDSIISRVGGLSFSGFEAIFGKASSSNKGLKKDVASGEEFDTKTENGKHSMVIVDMDSSEYQAVNPVKTLDETAQEASNTAMELIANSEKDYGFLSGYYVKRTYDFGGKEIVENDRFYGETGENRLTFLNRHKNSEETKINTTETNYIISKRNEHNVLNKIRKYDYDGQLENTQKIKNVSLVSVEDAVSYASYTAEDLAYNENDHYVNVAIDKVFKNEEDIWCSLSVKTALDRETSKITYSYIEKHEEKIHIYSGSDDVNAIASEDTILNDLEDQYLSSLLSEEISIDKTAPIERMQESLYANNASFFEGVPDPISGEEYAKIYQSLPKANVSVVELSEHANVGELSYNLPLNIYECKKKEFFGKYSSRELWSYKDNKNEPLLTSGTVGFWLVFETVESGNADYEIESISVNDQPIEKQGNLFFYQVQEEADLKFVIKRVASEKVNAHVVWRSAEWPAMAEIYSATSLYPGESYEGPKSSEFDLARTYLYDSFFEGWLTPLCDEAGSFEDVYVGVGRFIVLFCYSMNNEFEAKPFVSYNVEGELVTENMSAHPTLPHIYYHEIKSTAELYVGAKSVEKDTSNTAYFTFGYGSILAGSDNRVMVSNSLDCIGVPSAEGNGVEIGQYVFITKPNIQSSNTEFVYYLIDGKPLKETVEFYGKTYFVHQVSEAGNHEVVLLTAPKNGETYHFVDLSALTCEYTVGQYNTLSRVNGTFPMDGDGYLMHCLYLIIYCEEALSKNGLLCNGEAMLTAEDRNGKTFFYYEPKASGDLVVTLA